MWHKHRDNLLTYLEYIAVISILIIGIGYLLGGCLVCSGKAYNYYEDSFK